MQVKEPSTSDEFKDYYRLRFQTLREPWGQAEGTEKAEDDDTATHAMLVNEAGEVIGVCRLHLQTPQEGQLRFMGIHPAYQGKGLGALLLEYLENKAKEMGATTMMLHAREKAVSFYIRNGYETVQESYLLFDSIQHYKMVKQL